jgi:Xaa-Pro aminopeptidase
MTPISEATLTRFRAAQQLAYACACEVADGLRAGDTERDAAGRMRAWLTARGVVEWLHVPFAWFGDRTAFRGFRTPLAFFPTRRRLEAGMPFILDCAPVVDGHTADIGYTAALGENRIVDRMLDDLAAHRALILEQVAAGRPVGEIYEAVTQRARLRGYEIRHRAYPFGVIGHRVEVLAPGRARGTVAGFGLRSLLGFRRGSLWNDRFAASRPLGEGVWAVEPHLGFRGVGAKFEELLVVDGAGARWLDDDLPHVRRWQTRLGVAA